MLELHAIIKGRVQKVGFRWTIVDCAEKFQLTGTVQNLPDGSVEVFAQGPKESLEAFLAFLKQNPGLARIDSIWCDYHTPIRCYQVFCII